MTKYTVGVTINAPISTVVEVEAENVDDAVKAAVDLILHDKHYQVVDFDGNKCEIVSDDVVIDSIDPGDPT